MISNWATAPASSSGRRELKQSMRFAWLVFSACTSNTLDQTCKDYPKSGTYTVDYACTMPDLDASDEAGDAAVEAGDASPSCAVINSCTNACIKGYAGPKVVNATNVYCQSKEIIDAGMRAHCAYNVQCY